MNHNIHEMTKNKPLLMHLATVCPLICCCQITKVISPSAGCEVLREVLVHADGYLESNGLLTKGAEAHSPQACALTVYLPG